MSLFLQTDDITRIYRKQIEIVPIIDNTGFKGESNHG
jgi:hypothetical protein